MSETWQASDTSKAEYIGIMEFQDRTGEQHSFEILLLPDDRLLFGGATNTGFLESGFMRLESGPWDLEELELQLQLQAYYDEGPQAAPRLVCNERM